ncbi:MAG: hypothetical protein ACP5L1_01310 [Caldivirga sp.]|uniref:hypothetical protein n=1 Tax=Caldivirga sp. TaxID=2080243 RepID=UPI003D120DAD
MMELKLKVRKLVEEMVMVDDVPEDVVNDVVSELGYYVKSGYSDELAERLVLSYRERIMSRLMSNINQHMPGRGSIEKVLPFLLRESLEEMGLSGYVSPMLYGQPVDLTISMGTFHAPVIIIGYKASRKDLYRISRLRSMGINPMVVSLDNNLKDAVKLKVDYLNEPKYYRIMIAGESLKKILGSVSLIGSRSVRPVRSMEVTYMLWSGLRRMGYLVVPGKRVSDLEVYGFGRYLIRIQGKPTMWDPYYRKFNTVLIITGGNGVRVKDSVILMGFDYLEKLINESGLRMSRLRRLVSREGDYVE